MLEKLSAKLADALVARALSSTVNASGGAVSATAMLGPSSSKFRAWPMLRKSEPVFWSPSLSVMVSVRVSTIRSAAESVFESSGLVASGCTTARCWSSVTRPAASTLTVKTSAPLMAVRPSTKPALTVSTTLWFVRVSTRPEATPALLTLSA
ncbi:hypothetical protein D3C87_1682820 [compost metagenome]